MAASVLDILPRSWNQWVLRTMVLLSLYLQVILIILGSRRKYMANRGIRIIVWLAYMSADTVATASLGILAGNTQVNCNSQNPNDALHAFWTPFLLLHLGGPDTITAYSLEDNELWKRHLITLLGQVGVAFYIFLTTPIHSALSFVSLPIFVAGILKYGERTWVLRSASPKNSRKSLRQRRNEHVANTKTNILSMNDFQQAYLLFHKAKQLFADFLLIFDDVSIIREILLEKSAMEAFKVVEIELGYMYDSIYTKASISYSKPGNYFTKQRKVKTNLKVFLLGKIKEKAEACVVNDSFNEQVQLQLLAERGEQVLTNMRCLVDFREYTIDVDFDHSILLWHIATCICDHMEGNHYNDLHEFSRSLSEYMLYLLVECPQMLPKGIGESFYLDTREQAKRIFKEKPQLAKAFKSRRGHPNLQQLIEETETVFDTITPGNKYGSQLNSGFKLAQKLQNKPNKWNLISEMWVEMLIYAASHCGWRSHAQQLMKGGELITHVAILMAHLGFSQQSKLGF